MTKKKAIIIGAGPAGLTAAYELLKKTDVVPVVFEALDDVGGISRTLKHNGNYMDIGGHRFFSKSDRVMNWWLNIFPIETENNKNKENVMLVRNRLSRIYFLRKFFNYPVTLSIDTLRKLSLLRVTKIIFSYIKSLIFKINPEKSLEDFFINRFGRKLYLTFFKDYTEKVWGVDCNKISPEWGAQRVKGLSVYKTVTSAVKKVFSKGNSISQKNVETSLIEKFLYPKYGPGQLWNEVAKQITEMGGNVKLYSKVQEINISGDKVISVKIKNILTGEETIEQADYFFSTMPVCDLINGLSGIEISEKIKRIASGLQYRDFITVGLLLNKLIVDINTENKNGLIPDTWIYIQEKDVKLGRLQVFNNWSPFMVKDKSKVWLGLEYFCNTGDELWEKDDYDITSLVTAELEQIGFIKKEDVVDAVVFKIPKTYPAYFGTYNEFEGIKEFTDSFSNLFLIGRNGMHKYNNQDHSMLTAMIAVENIINKRTDKSNIWNVNSEQDYHEETK